MRTRGQFKFVLAMLMPLHACAQSVTTPDTNTQLVQRGRLMPPAVLQCKRNDLTSYAGLVTRYSRTTEKITVTIDTDADTTESVAISHYNVGSFLLNGEAFVTADWQRIESKPGMLRPAMRVIAWVCLDGVTPPVLDWRL